MERGWTRAPGPVGRGLDPLLPEELREAADPRSGGWSGEEGWIELERLLDLYGRVGRVVLADIGGAYPIELERDVRARVWEIREAADTSRNAD